MAAERAAVYPPTAGAGSPTKNGSVPERRELELRHPGPLVCHCASGIASQHSTDAAIRGSDCPDADWQAGKETKQFWRYRAINNGHVESCPLG